MFLLTYPFYHFRTWHDGSAELCKFGEILIVPSAIYTTFKADSTKSARVINGKKPPGDPKAPKNLHAFASGRILKTNVGRKFIQAVDAAAL